jgi:hypothetical protein
MRLDVPEATLQMQTRIDQEPAAAKTEFEQIFWNASTGRYRFGDGTRGITGRMGIQNDWTGKEILRRSDRANQRTRQVTTVARCTKRGR